MVEAVAQNATAEMRKEIMFLVRKVPLGLFVHMFQIAWPVYKNTNGNC